MEHATVIGDGWRVIDVVENGRVVETLRIRTGVVVIDWDAAFQEAKRKVLSKEKE